MKKVMRILFPLVLALLIVGSTVWYFTVYDRTFTRDLLLSQARHNDLNGNQQLSAWFYDLAYKQSGNNENVAIELAKQYSDAKNYTKAEVTLSNAIRNHPNIELYMALCGTYVEQDKLLDAVALLENIADPAISKAIASMRPEAPAADHAPGFYTQYIDLTFDSHGSVTYYTTDGDYPSTARPPYDAPIHLENGETQVYAISVNDDGLVSPMTVLNYTVGGVIEPVVFQDVNMEKVVREALGISGNKLLYTSDLWALTEFSVPAEVTNLDDLQRMTYVEKLTISPRNLSSLDALSPMVNLTELDISGCLFPAAQMQTLTKLPKLSRLTMESCNLSTLNDLSGAPCLTYLNITNNTVRNLEVLGTIPTLVELNLQHNAIVSLDALGALSGLRVLDVSYNSLTTLAPLAACGRLTTLDASHNTISRLDGIAGLNLLDSIALDFNYLTDLTNLTTCQNLTRITVSNNQLSNISCLSSLSKLDTLDFSYNNISQLPEFAKSSALRLIDGSHNLVASLDNLKDLENLTYVYMDYNRITNVDALEKSFSLVQVNVFGNVIADVSKLTDHNIIVNYDPTNTEITARSTTPTTEPTTAPTTGDK